MYEEQASTHPAAIGERWMVSAVSGVRAAVWSALADILLAVALFMLHISLMQSFLQGNPDAPPPPAWHYAIVFAGCGAVAVRQRLPRTAFAVVLAVGVVSAQLPYPVVVGLPIMWIALYTVGSRCAVGWVVSAAAASCGLLLYDMSRDPYPVEAHDVVITVLMPTVFAVLGWVVRRSRQRAVELEQAMDRLRQAERKLAADAVLVERNRIARDLHDIVAHGLSLIALRAGVARFLLPDDQLAAKEAVEVIESAARESSAEMRHMLGALRSTGEDAEAQEPHRQPGLDRLDDLVNAARSSGLPVNVIREGTPRVLPPGQELAAYRIVQEALTNVLKHAATAHVTVTVEHLPYKLVVDVFNTAPQRQLVPVTAAASLPTQGQGGHGLIGMRERVGLYGGTLQAHPVLGGFRVTAEIPIGAP